MTIDSVITQNNSLEPLFLFSDTVAYVDDSDSITFKTYVVNTLNNNLLPLIERKSLFRNITLDNSKNIIDKPIYKTDNYSWIFVVFILVIISFIIFSKTNTKRTRDLLSYAFSNKKINTLSKEAGLLNEISLFLGVLVFIPMFSLVLFSLLEYYSGLDFFGISSNLIIYCLIFLGSILFFFTKNLLVYGIGIIFNSKYKIKLYITNQILFYAIKGFVLLPFVFLYFFLNIFQPEVLLFTILILYLILFIIRLIRGFYLTLNDSKFSRVYLFIYLCSLELLPLVIIYKLFIGR